MINECATRAIGLYLSHPLRLTLVAAVALPVNVATYLIDDPTLSTLVTFPLALVTAILFSALIHAANEATAGLQPSFVRSYRWLFDRLSAVIETEIRYFGAAFLLLITIVGIPWSIRLFVRWFFAQYAVVIADAEPSAAISESCQLVSGRWWITAGRLVAPYLVIVTPSIAMAFFVPVIGQLIWSILAALVISPIFAAYFTTLYLEYKRTSQPPPDPSPSV